MSVKVQEEVSANIELPASGWVELFLESNSIKYKKSDGNVLTLSTGVTAEEVQDIVGGFIVDIEGIDVNYNDAGDILSIGIEESYFAAVAFSGDYDDLTNLPTLGSMASENVADYVPVTRNINTGAGLNGGGQLNADRTINLDNQSLTPGNYTNVDLTVNSKGIITAISNGANVSVFGSEFWKFSSEGISSTTSSTYQDKINVNTNTLIAGQEYRIAFYCEHQNQTSDDLSQVRITIDEDEKAFQSIEQEDTRDWHSFNGFFYFTPVSNGTVNLEMDYREQSGGTARIQRARFELWRVS